MNLIEEARTLVQAGANADTLYRHWFHRETGVLISWPTAAAYRAAILTPDRLEGGWRVLRAGLPGEPAGAVLAMRGGRQRLVAPPEMTPEDPLVLAPALGANVRIDPLISAESGGFWHLWSVPWQRQAPAHFYRLYCRVQPRHAFAFVQAVTRIAPPRPNMGSQDSHRAQGRRPPRWRPPLSRQRHPFGRWLGSGASQHRRRRLRRSAATLRRASPPRHRPRARPGRRPKLRPSRLRRHARRRRPRRRPGSLRGRRPGRPLRHPGPPPSERGSCRMTSAPNTSAMCRLTSLPPARLHTLRSSPPHLVILTAAPARRPQWQTSQPAQPPRPGEPAA